MPSLSASELAAKGNEIVDAQNRFFDGLPCFMPLCPFERPPNRLYGTPLNSREKSFFQWIPFLPQGLLATIAGLRIFP